MNEISITFDGLIPSIRCYFYKSQEVLVFLHSVLLPSLCSLWSAKDHSLHPRDPTQLVPDLLKLKVNSGKKKKKKKNSESYSIFWIVYRGKIACCC